jgi:hypothetical protein
MGDFRFQIGNQLGQSIQSPLFSTEGENRHLLVSLIPISTMELRLGKGEFFVFGMNFFDLFMIESI